MDKQSNTFRLTLSTSHIYIKSNELNYGFTSNYLRYRYQNLHMAG